MSDNHSRLAASVQQFATRLAGVRRRVQTRAKAGGEARPARRLLLRIEGDDMASPMLDVRQPHYQEVKSRIHEQLLNRLNLERLSQVKREEAEPELRSVIGALLEREAETTPLSLYERDSIVMDVLNELFGLGPLEAMLRDPDVSDILVNRLQPDLRREERHASNRSTPSSRTTGI